MKHEYSVYFLFCIVEAIVIYLGLSTAVLGSFFLILRLGGSWQAVHTGCRPGWGALSQCWVFKIWFSLFSTDSLFTAALFPLRAYWAHPFTLKGTWSELVANRHTSWFDLQPHNSTKGHYHLLCMHRECACILFNLIVGPSKAILQLNHSQLPQKIRPGSIWNWIIFFMN